MLKTQKNERKKIMKFSADKNRLIEAIQNASKATATNSSIAALEGILLNLKNDKLTVTGYDLEMGIKSIIPVITSEEEGEIVLNAKLISEMLKKMPSGKEIEIETKNDTEVTIKCDKVQFKLQGVSGQNYPNIPEIKIETTFNIKENVLKSMIRQTIFAAATNDIKPILTGTLFEIVDNELRVVCVDGIRVAKRVEKIEYKDLKFVAPAKTLYELLRILSDDEEKAKDIMIVVERNQLGFYRDDYMIISRLLEGEFIDYARFINFTPTIEAVVNAREFASSLDRTLLLTEKFKSPVVCTFENNMLYVNCNTNLGSINDSIKIDYNYPKMEIAFNARFMMDALRNAECDEVKLQFTTPIAPIKISPLGEEDFTFLVLPVRVK